MSEQQLKALLPEGVAVPENRAQTALLLWNTAGRPEPAAKPAFPDVADPDTAKAAQWCVEQGLMNLKFRGRFAPDGSSPAYKTLNALITIVHYFCAFIDRQNVPFDCAIDPSSNPAFIKVPGQSAQVKRTVRGQGNGVNIIKIGMVNICNSEIEIRIVVQIQAGEMVILKHQCSQVWTAADVQRGQLVVLAPQLLHGNHILQIQLGQWHSQREHSDGQ